ncbi:MAG TPA: 30S ribosomal protein S20 [Acidimicrobiia bacterium]|jgi:small subunit ribosomal protein S20
MANIKSQKKRNIQNEKRRVRNLAVRSELKTRIKGATVAAENDAEDAADRVVVAQKRLGKAGAKGIIHKNAAARRTSRLMKAANKAQADS